MKKIIAPIDVNLLKRELTLDKLLRPTNKAHNEVYIVNAHNAPNTMREIGRLREISFRAAGGGSGGEVDIDEYDTMPSPYWQLIVWDPNAEKIVGGYRFISGRRVEFDECGQPKFTMSHLFKFNRNFIENYLPYAIELGRAFVQPEYQTARMGIKSMFALDNIWDGLGALIHSAPEVRYFIGKITIYNDYQPEARELIYEYMHRYFSDKEQLIEPHKSIEINRASQETADKIFDNNNSVQQNYRTLQKAVKSLGTTVPPLFNAYIGLSDTLRMFGTAQDPDFGSTYETGIMLTISDLSESKRKRYIEPYIEYLKTVISEIKETAVKQRDKIVNRNRSNKEKRKRKERK
ncbi:MAG: GNAT family N-acetyltransferase [Paludibacter sp.]|jgi:hypothetical protein|nr:GNAT family N-acetyltransferase [Paludibacter sp.]